MIASDHHLLVFGATGAIGGEVIRSAVETGWRVTGVARKRPATPIQGVEYLCVDPLDSGFSPEMLSGSSIYNAVCWAQGANTSDSVYTVDLDVHRQIYEANCLYILVTLRALLNYPLLERNSRLCVVSSIWQNLARQSKLSYCVSKAALQGLVLSASADLAKDGHLINAVLPGALDTPMTRQNLTAEQMERLSSATGHHRLASLNDVSSLVLYLSSSINTGVTGQFIETDLGFSHVRIV